MNRVLLAVAAGKRHWRCEELIADRKLIGDLMRAHLDGLVRRPRVRLRRDWKGSIEDTFIPLDVHVPGLTETGQAMVQGFLQRPSPPAADDAQGYSRRRRRHGARRQEAKNRVS